jgi:hypothetical protein
LFVRTLSEVFASDLQTGGTLLQKGSVVAVTLPELRGFEVLASRDNPPAGKSQPSEGVDKVMSAKNTLSGDIPRVSSRQSIASESGYDTANDDEHKSPRLTADADPDGLSSTLLLSVGCSDYIYTPPTRTVHAHGRHAPTAHCSRPQHARSVAVKRNVPMIRTN